MYRLYATCCVLLLFAVSALAADFPALEATPVLPSDAMPSSDLPVTINGDRAMEHIRKLSSLGPRVSGTASERAAGDYILETMKQEGINAYTEQVTLPRGRISRNIIGVIPGRSTDNKKIILGAHYDSVPGSPGANDNASGVALLLEIVRLVPKKELPFTLVLIGFGAEEVMPGTGGRHHFGSHRFVANRTSSELRNMTAMLSLDMVGAGRNLQIGHCTAGNDRLAATLRDISGANPQRFIMCNSDDRAFALRGIPSAHVRWYPYDSYHKRSDTADKIDAAMINIVARIVLRWLDTGAITSR